MPAGIRRLGSWIDSYVEFTEILPSPPLFRKWVAISTIASALERKVWVRTMGSDLYPGLYTILVGPPGVGKGKAIAPAETLLRSVPDLHVGPSDVSAASLIDALNESVRRIVLMGDPPFVEFNSVTVIARELGVLIPAWETALMSNLTDIYDGFVLDQRRRGRDLRIKILHPQINLLGATTPGYLNDVMPQGAWDQGFISRTLLIYSGDKSLRDPFGDEEGGSPYLLRLQGDLLHDLKTISLEFGKMSFTTPAATAIKAWIKQGCQPEPQHAKLQHYNSRRIAHLLKLCMIASMSRAGDRVITIEDYALALNLLLEAEVYMPDIFRAMSSGGDSTAMEDCWHYVWTIHKKEDKPIAEHRIVHYLRERIPAHSVMKVLEIMVKAKMFEIIPTNSGFVGYKPLPKGDQHGR